MRTRAWIAVAGSGAAVIGAVGAAIGPGAAWLVDQFADGQRVWRLGRIQVDGVTGAWLGDLRAAHITIADDDGVWLEAEDIALTWRPQDIAFGALRIDAASIARANVVRQPELSDRRSTRGGTIDTQVSSVRIDSLRLTEPVFGQAAEFTASLSLSTEGATLRQLTAEVLRIDSDADRAVVRYRNDGAFGVDADVIGAPGGILARALEVPDSAVSAYARGGGDGRTGEAAFEARVGDAQLAGGDVHWTPARWALDANGTLNALPALSTLARRIGSPITLSASGERAGAFTARAQTPFVTANLDGELDTQGQLVGAANLVATTERLSDIARESPFALGGARLEGQLRRARGTTAIRATLTARQVQAFGASSSLAGPVELALTPERFTLSGNLAAPEDAPPLFARARLHTALEYDRQRARFELQRAAFSSDALSVGAQGWTRGGDGEYSGAWRVRTLGALLAGMSGEASGRWRAFAEERGESRVWTTSVDGLGARVASAAETITQLLGSSPRLDARLVNENGGVTVSHARLNGARLRAAVLGRIVRGQADLALEASAQGPVSLGGAQIAGAADAHGRITGPLARPTLTATANLASFDAAGVSIDAPEITFVIAPAANGYAGNASVEGQTLGQTLSATAGLGIADGAFEFSDVDAHLGALHANGAVSIGQAGASGDLALSGALDGIAGVTGQITGDLAFSPETLRLNAEIANARAGALRVRAANVSAEGPPNAIAATFDLRGRLNEAPFAFAGTGTIGLTGDQTTFRADGRGQLAGVDVFTRAPLSARWGDDTLETSLSVALGDGVVNAQWGERGRSISGAAQIEDAPLAPLAAMFGEQATGRIDGAVALASQGNGLRGNSDITFQNARFAGRQRGALNVHVVSRLDPSRLEANIDARSDDGLTARLEASAPVVTSAAPIRIALAPDRRGRATWSVAGEAASLWAAARLPDQALEGRLQGEGELEFGAGYLSGDGFVEIVDGEFEDKLTGVRLVDLDARVALDRRGITIESFRAAGANGGVLTASGGSATPRRGEISVVVTGMRVADRPEARAVADGALTLAWEGLESTLSGDIDIRSANLDIAARAEAGIPTIDVVEINRPDQEDDEEEQAPHRNGSTRLNVNVSAPGQIFTRGRGVDAEWSLDMRLAGTARAPLVFGQAQAIRGTLALSGQPFEIQSARIIFDGDPLDARVDLTAERNTADLTATMRLSGTARDPEVSFTSDPGLPEDEILPQVLFGRSVADLSAFEAAQLAASLATLSGQASLDLVGAARAAVGLDRLNVRQDENGGLLVAGGVYLTRDVYVEVARDGLGQAQTALEWTMRPRLVLITSFLANGDQSVSLRWRRESD